MKKELGYSFWGIIDTAIYPAIYLALVPFLMHGLGDDGFGLWIIINSVMVILQLLNMNIGVTTMKELASRSKKDAHKILNDLVSIVLILFLLASLVGFTTGIFAENFGFLSLSNAPVRSILECLLLAGIIAGLKFFEQFFHAALKAQELIRASALLNIVNRIGLLAVTVYLAINGYDITALLYANLFFTLSFLCFIFLVVSRHYHNYIPVISNNINLIGSLFHFSIWPWLQSLFVVIAFQTDRFWVSAEAGLSEVSNYGLIATLFNHIHMIFTAMFIWVLPRIAAMSKANINPYPFYKKIKKVFALFVVFSLLFFHFLSPWIFPLWVGNEHYENMKNYLQLFLVFELFFTHTIMPFFYMNATSRERTITYLTGFFCLLSYFFMFFFLKATGSIAMMISGMALSMCISMPVLNFVVRKKSSDSTKSIIHEFLEMLPFYTAAALILMPMPWSLLLLIPLIIWAFSYLPLLNQIKNHGKIYSIGK